MFTTMRHALVSGGDGGGNEVHRIDSRGLHVDGWLAMVLMHSNAAGRPVAQLPGIDEVKIILSSTAATTSTEYLQLQLVVVLRSVV